MSPRLEKVMLDIKISSVVRDVREELMMMARTAQAPVASCQMMENVHLALSKPDLSATEVKDQADALMMMARVISAPYATCERLDQLSQRLEKSLWA